MYHSIEFCWVLNVPLLSLLLLGEPILCNIHLPSYKDLNDPHNLLGEVGLCTSVLGQ